MRSILIILLVILYLIITLPVALILSLIRRKDEKRAERGAHACINWVFKAILFLADTKITEKGLENVPADQPVLYVSNHRSFFDVLVTYPSCKLPTSYIAKDSLTKIPLFSTWGKLMRVLFFDRTDPKKSVKMILDGVERLKDDTSVYIFPEGTRNKNTDECPLLEFHNGSFKMASRSGCLIVPVAIDNTMSIWEAHMPWVKRTKVTVTYCKPFYMKDLEKEDQKAIGKYVQNIIETELTAQSMTP